MGTTTIRIRPQSHHALKEIAAITGQSLQDVLDQAIEESRRRLYLEGANADYALLQGDAKAMAELNTEIAAWDVTNLDGLEER
jgi:hypothetical protein